MRLWKGEQAAAAWVEKTLPPAFKGPFGPFAFIRGEYSLLWDVIDPATAGSEASYVWLARAAASADVGPDDPHRPVLLAPAFWNRACISTGLRNNGEYHWSAQQLTSWSRKSMSLKRIGTLSKEERRVWSTPAD